MRFLATGLVVSALLAASPAHSQESGWLPPPVEEGLAQQLAERLQSLGDENSDAAELLRGARQLVRVMRETVDACGAAGAAAKAPQFADFDVPRSDQQHLDAMGRWSICSLVLLVQIDNAARTGDGNAGLKATLGLSAVTLAILRLREPFVAAGRQQPEIEAHLTSAGFETSLAAIQGEVRLLDHARDRCEPPLRELLAAPIAYLRQQGEKKP